MRRLALRLAACALLGAGVAQAEPFTVDHLLAQQKLGTVSIDPSQRWLVVPVTAPYASAPRWDLIDDTRRTITQLRVFDLKQGGPARAFPGSVGTLEAWGYTPGPYSPSGDKMAITRARGRFLEVGSLTLATGGVVWTGLHPISDFLCPPVQWRGEDELLVLAKTPETLESPVSWQIENRLAERWAQSAAGKAGVSVMGAGKYAAMTPDPAPRRLVLVDAKTGLGRTVATGAFVDFALAPDGRQAAMLVKGRALAADPHRPVFTTEPTQSFRLQVVHIEDGTAWTPCPDCDVSPDLLTWSKAGGRLLVHARKDGEAWSAARYRTIDPTPRRMAVLDSPSVRPAVDRLPWARAYPVADWMGDTPMTLGRNDRAGAGNADWIAWRAGQPHNLTAALPPGPRRLVAKADDHIVVEVGEHLWRIDGSGLTRALGPAAAVSGPGIRIGERMALNDRPGADDLALSLSAGPATRSAAVLREVPRQIGVEAPADERLLVVASKARAVASLRRDAHGVETVMLRQAGQAPRALATINSQLAKVNFATPIAIDHLGPGGQALTSWLYLPPGHRPGTKLPVLVFPYAGRDWKSPHPLHAPPASVLFQNAQLMAGAGYAVLIPSLPIDEGREPAQGLANDILKIVDAAGAAQPDLDVARLALWGHSYGGWTVLTAATQSPRFKAVIAGAFTGDLISHYARGGPWLTAAADEGAPYLEAAGWSELGQGRMGVPPWVDPQRYLRNSPFYSADKINVPVMLIMGDLDSDVGQSAMMFTALFRQDKDVISLMYHGEGHTYFTPANVADLHNRVFAFLKDNIGPGS